MKRWLLFVLLLGLLFATALPVSAAGNGRSNFTLAGRITAIGDDTVTIEFLSGNKTVKPYLDSEWPVTVTGSTRYLLKDGDLTVPITFADLKEDDLVSVHGTFVGNVWTASRITVGAKLIHFP